MGGYVNVLFLALLNEDEVLVTRLTCVGFGGVRRPEWKVSCEFDKKVLIFIFKKAPGKRKTR